MLPGLSNIQDRNLTPQQIRRTGWVLVVVGLFMVALMSVVGALLLDFITLEELIPGTYRDKTAEPAEVSIAAYGFVGFCLLFGFVSTVAGAYQVWTGRRSKTLVVIILVMGAIFVVVGMIARGLR